MNFHLLICIGLCLSTLAKAEDTAREIAVMLVAAKADGSKQPEWKLLHGKEQESLDEIRQNWATLSPEQPLVYLLEKSPEGKWLDLTRSLALADVEMPPVPLKVSVPPSQPAADIQACLSSLADCWLTEPDLMRLYLHTQKIAACASPVLYEGYATRALDSSIPDDFRKLCAALVVARVSPEKAFAAYFDAFSMKLTRNEFKDAMISEFRAKLLNQLGAATNAANFDKHWTLLTSLPKEFKPLALSELTGRPFDRKTDALDPKQFLTPHRAELLNLLRTAKNDLAYGAYLAICLADEISQNTYPSVEDFSAHREEALKSLEAR